jgi:hypothetical protein
MAPSRVIRIDDQVWAELQRRARPLEDTPNSVLRRVFGLPAAEAEPEGMDPRVARLLELVQQSVGRRPELDLVRKGYSLRSDSGEAIAYIRPQQERLRVEVSREMAESAGVSHWDRERTRGFFGGPAVRWYVPDGDDSAYQLLAAVLAKLWRSNPTPTPPGLTS